MNTTKKQSKKFSVLYVSLGKQCNFKCKYCIQCANMLLSSVPSPDDSGDFTPIKEFIKKNSPKKIMLWGGEPLLYWDKIIRFVPWIRQELPDCLLTMITNGSLLTHDKVDFINRYDIHVGLSHDAFATVDTRNVDVLQNEEIYDSYVRIIHKSINTVLSAQVQDLYKVWSFYDELFGKFVHVNFESYKDFVNNPCLQKFDITKFKETLEMVKDKFVKDVLGDKYDTREFLFFQKYVRLIYGVTQKGASPKPACGTFSSALCLNFQGDIYLCNNSDAVIGNIKDIDAAETEFMKHVDTPSACKECPCLGVCGYASCVAAADAVKLRGCEIERMVYKAVMDALNELLKTKGGGWNEQH